MFTCHSISFGAGKRGEVLTTSPHPQPLGGESGALSTADGGPARARIDGCVIWEDKFQALNLFQTAGLGTYASPRLAGFDFSVDKVDFFPPSPPPPSLLCPTPTHPLPSLAPFVCTCSVCQLLPLMVPLSQSLSSWGDPVPVDWTLKSSH